MAFERSKEPVSDLAGAYEQRIATRGVLAIGTLACPRCDAPVVLASEPVAPADRLDCPFCAHAGSVRDFLSLEPPVRPTRVRVRVVRRSA